MISNRLFASGSLSKGHWDKLADQISDGHLDVLLRQGPNALVGLVERNRRGTAAGHF